MLTIFSLALQAAVGVLILAAIIALLRLVTELLIRLAAALVIAAFLGVLIGIVAAQFGYDGRLSGLAAASIAYLPALASIWWMREIGWSSVDRRPRRAETDTAKKTRDRQLPEKPIETQLGLKDADKMIRAWEVAERLDRSAGLDKARDSCARLLSAFENSSDLDPTAMDMKIFIRRHVPGLVTDTEKVLILAEPAERAHAISEMVAALRKLGDEADRMLSNMRADAVDHLRARRTRFTYRQDEISEQLGS